MQLSRITCARAGREMAIRHVSSHQRCRRASLRPECARSRHRLHVFWPPPLPCPLPLPPPAALHDAHPPLPGRLLPLSAAWRSSRLLQRLMRPLGHLHRGLTASSCGRRAAHFSSCIAPEWVCDKQGSCVCSRLADLLLTRCPDAAGSLIGTSASALEMFKTVISRHCDSIAVPCVMLDAPAQAEKLPQMPCADDGACSERRCFDGYVDCALAQSCASRCRCVQILHFPLHMKQGRPGRPCLVNLTHACTCAHCA